MSKIKKVDNIDSARAMAAKDSYPLTYKDDYIREHYLKMGEK